MKNILPIASVLAFILSISMTKPCAAQGSVELQIISPFKEITLTDVKATGNKKNGMVEVSMNFKNESSQSAGVSLSLGGFPDFGITDSKGHKYKLFTDVNAVNSNKGYQNIPFIQFGDKKFDWVALVKQEFPSGEMRKLSVRFKSTEAASPALTDFHIRCILSLDYANVGDKLYELKNLKVDWK
ncbi:hypothetical protein [Chitinophaga sp. Ak27]|uniref:hypothetical protein n=1 Tax=Chitinophaga sp. Ak27 TaxID=2726116 RepID=UPI00145EC62E|nr:hypothetical protein [Chitinophaga sp. Ak27]NLU94836.1 hypothetical protein [Chitinophaga sp. Ak27]